MSLYDFQFSRQVLQVDPPFYGLIMAAMSKADTMNAARLRSAFPEVWAECEARYNARGGVLADD